MQRAPDGESYTALASKSGILLSQSSSSVPPSALPFYTVRIFIFHNAHCLIYAHIRTHTTHNHFTVHPDGAHTPSWASGLHEGEISLQINKCMKLMMKYLDDRSGGSLHVLAHLVQITWTLYRRELCEPCHTVGICLYFSYVYSSIGVGAFLFFYIVCI